METEQLQRSIEFELVSQNFEAKTWDERQVPLENKSTYQPLSLDMITNAISECFNTPTERKVTLYTDIGGLKLFHEAMKKEAEKFGYFEK